MQGFCACWQSCSDGCMDFLFFLKGDSLAGFIYLETAGNHSSRSQSIAHIKQFNFFLSCHGFSLLIGIKSSITNGMSYGFHDVIQDLWYFTTHDKKYARTTSVHFSLWWAICWRVELLMQRWLASHSILSRYLALELNTTTTGCGYEIMTVVQ